MKDIIIDKYEGIMKKYVPLYMGCGTWKNSDLGGVERYADRIPERLSPKQKANLPLKYTQTEREREREWEGERGGNSRKR